jgi:hypothetical protein
MVKFCRNCGYELHSNLDKTCPHCGVNAVKATTHCRYCGELTSITDAVCPTCGAAIRPIAGSARQITTENVKLVKLGKTINLTIVVLLVSAYVIFSLPKTITKPVKAAASDAVLASTGYTAFPLASISAIPSKMPPGDPKAQIAGFYGNANAVVFNVFEPGDTRLFSVYATYKSDSDASKVEDVTANCSFKSSNESVAKVAPGGVVQAVADGSTTINVFYTAAPGTSNRDNAAAGKIPVTFTAKVAVTVTTLPPGLGGHVTP